MADTDTEAEAVLAPAYREVDGFKDALKSAVSLAKENEELKPVLQLVRHLSWGTPRSTVSWAAGTTETVVATANDLAIADGTPVPEALATAIKVAGETATGKPQKDAVSVLGKLVKSNT